MVETTEYRDDFKFTTHIETAEMPVALSCRVLVQKFSHDSICLQFDSEIDEQEPMVFVDIDEDGLPCVVLHVGTEDEQFRLQLRDGQWRLKTAPLTPD
jgi:hypothetical protein